MPAGPSPPSSTTPPTILPTSPSWRPSDTLPWTVRPRRCNRRWPPWLDSRGEVMAKERRVGMHPGEALAEMREKGHARHRIRSKIQEVETKGMHDVAEEIKEGRTEPAGKIIDK